MSDLSRSADSVYSQQSNNDELRSDIPQKSTIGDESAAARSVILTREEAASIVQEFNVLYGIIEGIRTYVLQQDAADGITALCDGLFSQSLRTLRKLEPLKRNVVVS